MAAFALVIIGGLNWGLVGLFDFNLVGAIFGFVPFLVRLIYLLVGAAAVVLLMPASSKVPTHAATPPISSPPAPPVPPPAPPMSPREEPQENIKMENGGDVLDEQGHPIALEKN